MTGIARTEPLVVRRHIPASPDEVFAAWTSPDKLRLWWGPPGVECTHAEVDLTVGGIFRLANRLPTGELLWISGRFEAIDAPHHLAHTWQVGAEFDAPQEHVVVDFVPAGDGTEITVTHRGIGSEEARLGHEGGWVGCLDGLAQLLSD
jgi:uncharacterized protein YndB with AHSA1/START domain